LENLLIAASFQSELELVVVCEFLVFQLELVLGLAIVDLIVTAVREPSMIERLLVYFTGHVQKFESFRERLLFDAIAADPRVPFDELPAIREAIQRCPRVTVRFLFTGERVAFVFAWRARAFSLEHEDQSSDGKRVLETVRPFGFLSAVGIVMKRLGHFLWVNLLQSNI